MKKNSIMKFKSLKKQFIIPLLVLIIPLVIISFIFLSFLLKGNIVKVIKSSMLKDITVFNQNKDRIQKKALFIATNMAQIAGIEKNYRKGNNSASRNKLRVITQPYYNSLVKNLKINNIKIHYHTRAAKSFLRLWRSRGKNDGGDDISSFRKTILDISKNHKPITSVEVGRGGVALRGIAPIVRGGRYYGSVETLFSFNEIYKYSEKNTNVVLLIDKKYAAIINEKGMRRKDEKSLKYKIGNYLYVSSSKKQIPDFINAEIIQKGNNPDYFKSIGNFYIKPVPLLDYKNKIIGMMIFITDVSDQISMLSRVQVVLFILVLLLSVAVILVINFIGGKVSKKIKLVTESLDEISRGEADLTKKMTIDSDDELGETSVRFNDFLEQMKSIIIIVKEASHFVSSASIEMRTSSETLSEETQQQAAAIEETMSAIEEMKATIDSVSGNAKNQAANANENRKLMDTLSLSIKKINTNAQDASSMINETYSYAKDGENVLNQTVDNMKEINKSSVKITEIITMISDISDQINLLSLNASIEAARAGEHGKGFAVVAEEISKLADQTASSSAEIDKLIQESFSKINTGSELVEKTAESLRKIIDNVKKTTASMEYIANLSVELDQMSGDVAVNASNVNRMSEEISTMMEEQSVSSNEIITAINGINEITQNVASGSEELSASAEELSSQSEVLQQVVNRFKVE